MSLNIIPGAILAGFLILVGHWFPWRHFLGRPLRRLEAYMYGTASIFLGFWVIAWLMDDMPALFWLGCTIVAAGSATFLAWGVDWIGIKISVMRRQAWRAKSNDGRSEQ